MRRRQWLETVAAAGAVALLGPARRALASGRPSTVEAAALPGPVVAAGPATASALAGAPLRIGVLPGPHAEVMAYVASLLKPQGLDLRPEVRPDAERLNHELAEGHLAATSAQSAVALSRAVRQDKLPLVAVMPTLTLPVAIYSRSVQRLGQLPAGARLALPAQGESSARALVLLHNYGLIQLRDDVGLHATTRDVLSTRRGIRLLPLAPDALRRSLDVGSRVADASLLDFAQASALGLQPARDAIGLEDARTPFADVLAVRQADAEAPWLRTLVQTYHSEPVKRFLLARYQESVRRPW